MEAETEQHNGGPLAVGDTVVVPEGLPKRVAHWNSAPDNYTVRKGGEGTVVSTDPTNRVAWVDFNGGEPRAVSYHKLTLVGLVGMDG